MSLFNKDTLDLIKRKSNEVMNRALDQHVNLAVTGLSRSGKTAFITSLVNQLITEQANSNLPFLDVVHQGRFIAAKRVPQKHKHIARFAYDEAMQFFCQQPAQWPVPTSGISELRLAIKYRPQDSLKKLVTESSTLYLDITDYPGEWLLDLPMLGQTYEEWSKETTALLLREPRKTAAKPLIDKLAKLSPFDPVDEQQLAELSAQYTELLNHFRHQLGLSVIQPGRFILPGDLAGAPILQFFPFTHFDQVDNDAYQKAGENTVIGMLRARFLEYKERVIKAFYREHFVNFDRQIILADCLTPLNRGAACFEDLQLALDMISESFRYGNSGLFSRLFSPQIDKLLFAATKADHVTPDQHNSLVSLLNQLVAKTRHQLTFENIDVETMAIASVKATVNGVGVHQGDEIQVIKGVNAETQQTTTLFPGEVPSSLPNAEHWQKQGFNFIQFIPQSIADGYSPLEHLRMDKVINYLIGDKLK